MSDQSTTPAPSPWECGKKIHLKVAVKDLPEGYFKERLMMIAESPESEVFVVAVIGYANDWSAYVGWPLALSLYGRQMDSTGYYQHEFSTWQGVAKCGDKMDEFEARNLFPEVPSELNYRR